MDKQPTFGNGKICYLQIPSFDVEQSAAFYHTVFGWRISRRSNGEVTFDDGVSEVSGMWVPNRKPVADPGIVISIMVDDITDTIDLILANGGKLLVPVGAEAPEITAIFSDPAGNVLGLYQHRRVHGR